MERIELFTDVLQYLKDGIVLCIKNPKLTYLFLKDNEVIVKNSNSRYSIPLNQLKEMFGKETFYVYQDNQESVDTQKDEEYYAWKNQGFH